MTLVEDIGEARTEFARATYALAEYREGLSGQVGSSNGRARAGAALVELEERVEAARRGLETTEQETLARAREILDAKDPGYAAKIAESKLEPGVEMHVLIGAADRLNS